MDTGTQATRRSRRKKKQEDRKATTHHKLLMRILQLTVKNPLLQHVNVGCRGAFEQESRQIASLVVSCESRRFMNGVEERTTWLGKSVGTQTNSRMSMGHIKVRHTANTSGHNVGPSRTHGKRCSKDDAVQCGESAKRGLHEEPQLLQRQSPLPRKVLKLTVDIANKTHNTDNEEHNVETGDETDAMVHAAARESPHTCATNRVYSRNSSRQAAENAFATRPAS